MISFSSYRNKEKKRGLILILPKSLSLQKQNENCEILYVPYILML